MYRFFLIFLLSFFSTSILLKAQTFTGEGSIYIDKILMSNDDKIICYGSFSKNMYFLGDTIEGVNHTYFAAFNNEGKIDFICPSLLNICDIEYANDNLIILGQFYRFTKLLGLRLSSHGDYKSFIASYNMKTKSINWHHVFEGKADVKSCNLAVDQYNNIYVCGSFEENISILGEKFSKLSNRSIFLASLSKDGEKRWVQKINAGNLTNLGTREVFVCVGDNKLYLSFSATGKIDCGALNYTTEKEFFNEESVVYGMNHIMLLYDFNGNIESIIPLTTQSTVQEMLYANGQIILGGTFTGKKSLGKNYATTILGEDHEIKANFDINRNILESPFVASYSPEGKVNWSYTINSTNIVKIKAIAADSQGNTYLSVFFFNNIMFAGKVYHSVGDEYYSDAAIVKLNNKGNLVNYTVFEGEGQDVFNDLYVHNDDLYATGFFYKSLKHDTIEYSSNSDYISSIIFKHNF